ncbi:MAG TPA: hypothetical protein PLU22_16575, partial [Polyangiaceae bacterium]|nr:hypothetical protein [Polyangiaceae bacterium]
LPTEAVMAALRRAAARWTTDVGCTGVTFRVLPPLLAADRARRDGVNTVLFHEQAWCRDGVRTRFSCYDREEQAMTTTYLDRSAPSGEVLIAEADVEINAVDYRWTAAATAAAPAPDGAEPLEDLLVHELGHVLGLAHGCDDGTLPVGAVDEQGARPARCPTEPKPPLPAMSPAPSAALLPVALTPDERRAVCELYPSPAPAPAAPARAARGCGCAIGARRTGDERAGAVLFALGVLAAALGRRSSRSLTTSRPARRPVPFGQEPAKPATGLSPAASR